MDDNRLNLALGAVLFAGGALALVASLVPGIAYPPLAYAFVALGLFLGVYLIGLSNPGRTV